MDSGRRNGLSSHLDFLSCVKDAELRSEIRSVLAQLELLSDAKATTIGRSAPSSERPVGPPEFRGLRAVDIPDEDRSLFEHYLARFQKLGRSGRPEQKPWWRLLWEAEDALKKRTVPPTESELALMVALVPNRTDDDQIEKALVKRVIEQYEGVDAFKVHLELKVPVGWVEHVREQEGRDPDLGEPRPAWRKLNPQTKYSIVEGLKDRGLTQEEVARKLGIGLRTVGEYWPKKVAA